MGDSIKDKKYKLIGVRDIFALEAMNGLLVSHPQMSYKYVAENSYAVADAMLKQRDNEK